MYNKREAVMTRGLAILCMVVLHLFCKKGIDVIYSPIVWISENKPLVYWFGFFAEICVPLYSICAGYARYLVVKSNNISYKKDFQKIFKLLLNYWIILAIFCTLGLFFDKEGKIPGNLIYFIKSIFLIHSYNGAWWYLNTYIILLLIPISLVLFPVNKLDYRIGIMGCFVLDFVWYFINRFDLLPNVQLETAVGTFVIKEVINLINVLPYFWIGACLCKANIFEICEKYMQKYPEKKRNGFLLCVLSVLFLLVNLFEKAILVGPVAVVVFLSFNLLKKPEIIQKIFYFLGRHSTNIWLIHMFFYAVLFKDLVWKAKYPVLILLFMLVLCISFSSVINCIYGSLIQKIRKLGTEV